MTNKTIDTLIDDIYGIFLNKDTVLSDDLLKELGESVVSSVKRAIEKASLETTQNIRLSNIGKPDRQLWYDINSPLAKHQLSGREYLNFLFGDIMEALLVYLIKEAGHSIKHFQEDLELNGVPGHPDGVIDGVPVDVKTASSFSFKNKFQNKGLLSAEPGSDSFGYKGQLASYRRALLDKYGNDETINEDEVAWLAFNKENGDLTLLRTDAYSLLDPVERIEEVKTFIQNPEPPPEKCYPDKPDGQSGNRVLHKLCEYCRYKHECWKDANEGRGLRVFEYSSGTKYFTQVNKLPRVQEKNEYEFTVESVE